MTPEQLQEIKDRVNRCWNDGSLFCKVAEEDAPALIEEVERLRATLEFYADSDWYHLKQNGEIIILRDAGEEARKALEGAE